VHWSYEACGSASHFFDKDMFLVVQHDLPPPDDFWSRVVDAFKQSLHGTILETFRPRDHEEEKLAVAEIVRTQQEKGRLNNTAFVSALLQPGHCKNVATNPSNCLLLNDGRAYKVLADHSIPTVFIEGGPDAAALGVGFIEMWPNNFEGERHIGYQYCNEPHPEGGRKLIYLKGPEGAEHCEQRINGFLSAVSETCGAGKKVIHSNYTVRADWDYGLAFGQVSHLMFEDPDIFGAIACNVQMALGAADAIEFRSYRARTKFFIGGFDLNPRSRDLLAAGSLKVLIDQQMQTANHGLVPKVREVVTNVFASRVAGNTAALAATPAMTNIAYSSPVVPEVTDREKYVLSSIMHSYSAQTRPVAADLATVSVSFTDFSVDNVDVAGNKFEATTWVVYEWLDARLRWDAKVFNGTLSLDVDQVWSPAIYLVNERSVQTEPLFRPMVLITSEGHVRQVEQRHIGYGCDTGRGIAFYPYDEHQCSIKISSIADRSLVRLKPVGITLGDAQTVGWKRPEPLPPYIETAGGAAALANQDDGTNKQDVLVFPVFLKRNSGRVFFKVIWPSYVLTLIGFSVFWLHTYDSKPLVTSVSFLALIALHTNEGNFDVEGLSWFDRFMLISATFQIVTWLLTSLEKAKVLRGDELNSDSSIRRSITMDLGTSASIRSSRSEEPDIPTSPIDESIKSIRSSRVTPWMSGAPPVQVSWHRPELLETICGRNVALPFGWWRLRSFYILTIGDRLESWEDRIGRRVVVPLYLIATCSLSLGAFQDGNDFLCPQVGIISSALSLVYLSCLVVLIIGLFYGGSAASLNQGSQYASTREETGGMASPQAISRVTDMLPVVAESVSSAAVIEESASHVTQDADPGNEEAIDDIASTDQRSSHVRL